MPPMRSNTKSDKERSCKSHRKNVVKRSRLLQGLDFHQCSLERGTFKTIIGNIDGFPDDRYW